MRKIIRDRGNIKWTAMMLPEHVTMLRELKEKNNYEHKPILDEQRLEELNEVICFSIETKQTVEITYYKDRLFQKTIGAIYHFDLILESIRMVDEENNTRKLEIKNIIDIQIVD